MLEQASSHMQANKIRLKWQINGILHGELPMLSNKAGRVLVAIMLLGIAVALTVGSWQLLIHLELLR